MGKEKHLVLRLGGLGDLVSLWLNAMGLNLSITVSLTGDRGAFERITTALRKPRELMHRIGVYALQRGKERLREHLDADQGEDKVRSGKLLSSIGSVFEVSDERVTAGTNVPYARQYQSGGTIVPKDMKALAIPLLPQLKRAGLWPRDLDPERKLLQLIPGKGGNRRCWSTRSGR